MSRKDNIEELLMRIRHEPGERVKRAVLARYTERYGGRRRPAAGPAGLWRRHVPLHVAAALVLIAAGLSFVGGQKLSRPEHPAEYAPTAVKDSLVGTPPEHRWHFAPADAF